MKVVVNRCYGGFSLSDAAYLWLATRGVPIQRYTEPVRDARTGLYKEPPENNGDIIFDRLLAADYKRANGLKPEPWDVRPGFLRTRYWDSFIREGRRSWPLLVECVESLGSKLASGKFAQLEVVEIPDDVKWHIEEYDGIESVAENHRSW